MSRLEPMEPGQTCIITVTLYAGDHEDLFDRIAEIVHNEEGFEGFVSARVRNEE
jgi:hypothetical protein